MGISDIRLDIDGELLFVMEDGNEFSVGMPTMAPAPAPVVVNNVGRGKTERSLEITSSSNAATLDASQGDNFVHDLTENVTYTFAGAKPSGDVTSFTLKVIQGSTARTITWPSSVDWAGGTAPTLTTTDDGVDVFVFLTHDGGTTYYGFTAGQAMA